MRAAFHRECGRQRSAAVLARTSTACTKIYLTVVAGVFGGSGDRVDREFTAAGAIITQQAEPCGSRAADHCLYWKEHRSIQPFVNFVTTYPDRIRSVKLTSVPNVPEVTLSTLATLSHCTSTVC